MVAIRTIAVLGILTYSVSGQEPASTETSLGQSSTKELVEEFEAEPRLDWPFVASMPEVHSEAVLHELMNRGSNALSQLQDFRQRAAAERRKSPTSPEDRWSLENDLGLLTAIRHLQGKASPLTINVVNAKNPIRGMTRKLPPLEVEIVNTDAMMHPVWFTFGGNYRSGRLSRWRIHLWDESGNQLPVITRKSGMGGGVYSEGKLMFGERDSRRLDIASFVRIRNPGKYTGQVMYHNSITIADIEEPRKLDDLILVKSEPFTLVVEHGPRITIELTNAEHRRAAELISQLNFTSTVKKIGSEYGPFYHEFIHPESAHGQILTMGKRAVPALLEALKDPDTSFRERGWLLAILDSIMDERYLSPTAVDGAMPSYKACFPGGHCTITTHPDNYSPAAQDQFVRAWTAFADEYIVVRDVDSDPEAVRGDQADESG